MGARVDVRGLLWTPAGGSRPVLSGLELQVEPGEKVLLAGPSGSGKSTLLRALAGVLDTIEPGVLGGRVRIDGLAPQARPGQVGLLLQDPGDARVAGRVGRDVAFGPENLGLPAGPFRRQVAWALHAVGFPYDEQRATAALSGGEAQRLGLAGVLAIGPGLVLLDEPTSMLDRGSAATAREAVLAAVARAQATLIVAEHQLEDWAPVMDRIVVLGVDGSIVADGPIASVLARQGAALAAQGLWVPHAPAPTPLAVSASLLAPRRAVPHGEVAVLASALRVARRPPLPLSVAHGRPIPAVVLDAIDAQVRAGEVWALRGPSGAGKSTLLAALCGLHAPTSGTVRAHRLLAGGREGPMHRWPSATLAAAVGWAPQSPTLTVVGHTVADSVLATVRALRLPGAEPALRARELVEALGLGGLAGRNPYQLSGGEQRRLALASAVAHGPGLIALDEPTAGLDRGAWSAVAGVLRAAREAGAALAVATHDEHLVALADEVIGLRAGRQALV